MEANRASFTFVTAIFGEPYRRAGEALIRSFSQHHDPTSLMVFTDLAIDHAHVIPSSLSQFLARIPDYYRTRPTAFKIPLLNDAFTYGSGKNLVWIDADTVVLGNIVMHFQLGSINVMALDRVELRKEPIGNGRAVSSNRYVTGNLFALPTRGEVKALERLMVERLSWPDASRSMSGDQILLNHLVHRGGVDVHWFGGPGSGWFSTGCAVELQNRKNHSEFREDPVNQRFTYRGEPLVVFAPTKLLLDISFMNGFDRFPPALRSRLRQILEWDELPVPARTALRVRRWLTWDFPTFARALLRRSTVLVRLRAGVRQLIQRRRFRSGTAS